MIDDMIQELRESKLESNHFFWIAAAADICFRFLVYLDSMSEKTGNLSLKLILELLKHFLYRKPVS